MNSRVTTFLRPLHSEFSPMQTTTPVACVSLFSGSHVAAYSQACLAASKGRRIRGRLANRLRDVLLNASHRHLLCEKGQRLQAKKSPYDILSSKLIPILAAGSITFLQEYHKRPRQINRRCSRPGYRQGLEEGDRMVRSVINGKEAQTPDGLTVSGLLAGRKVGRRRC